MKFLRRWGMVLVSFPLTVILVIHGEAIGAALWGVVFGLEYAEGSRQRREDRSRRPELRVGLTQDQALRIHDLIEAGEGFEVTASVPSSAERECMDLEGAC